MGALQQYELEGIPHPQPKSELAVVTPMALLRVALDQNADIDKLAKLMDLQERWEANEARKAFVSAMNAFKASPPEIRKNRHVQFGNTNYDHATLDHVVDAISAGLSRHGISHRWDIEQKAGAIRVTCILTHDLGHSERTALEATADTSGSKNAIQAIGSAVTYLQRYTLLSATGLAAKNGDNDGATAGAAKLEDLDERLEWLRNATNSEELQRLFKDAYKKAAAANDAHAMQLLVKVKDERKAQLR